MGVVFFVIAMLNTFARTSRQVTRQSGRSLCTAEKAYFTNTRRTFSLARTTLGANRVVLPVSVSCKTNTNAHFVQYGATRQYASSSDDFPPHIPLGMPALSPTMTQGNLVKWFKNPGDEVSVGDALADIETDKATMKWDSIDDGFFVKAFIEEGTNDVPVGKVIALLAEDKDDVESFENYVPPEALDEDGNVQEEPAKEEKKEAPKKEEKKSEKPKEQPKKKTTESKPAAKQSSGGRIFASPAARALASEKGIELSDVEGSGPNGRIVVGDIENFKGKTSASSSSAPKSSPSSGSSTISGEYEDIPNSNIRKVIASRLTESKQTIPHYYLTVEFNVDKLQKIRAELNERAAGAYKLSINDFVIKASAMAMRKVPEVNSTWSDKAIRRYRDVNINVAVNSDAGLFTPLVPNTDNKGLADISSSVRSLAEKAKAGKLSPDELSIGTFTISNLGMFGIKQFAAVINPPQACILAVGGIEKRVVADGEGWKTADFMTCTLSCDHRVVDGALGANWLKEFKSRMEDPITLLL